MSEGLKRFRQPAAWLVLVAVVVLMAVDVVRLVLAVRGPTGLDAFAAHGLSLLSPVNAIVLLLAVAWCAVLRPITPGARKLTIAALTVALIGTVAQFVFGVIGLVRAGRRAGVFSAVIDAIGYLGFTILPVVAVVALAKILGGLRREEFRRIEAQEMTVELPRPGSAPADAESDQAPQTEPTWRPDEASGAAWQTAGAAAAGAQASGWGRPGERGGWTPANREMEQIPEPDQSPDDDHEEATVDDDHEEATVIRRLPAAEDAPREDPQVESEADRPVRRQPPQWKPLDRG
ncbi:DUF456 domain-containing protein [Enemella evansiae]|uniref:DUF456 domain-containing protein n=1 Tax=Enemella evansiae TaxID=2016499 RepID=UPI000B963682|nr:DUF456 domain-containing protein [Enemella evansiae]OYO11452.1 hypothetical protein BI335_16650 [Enemella evansiae]